MGTIASPAVVRSIVKQYGFRFKKSLGQNFLVDQNIIKKICSSANLSEKDLVVEIGPGIGSLTEELAKNAGHVLAVELDRDLIDILQGNLQEYNNIKVINGDVLKVNLDEEVASINKFFGRDAAPYKVVANLPYYITTPVIMYLLETGFNISQIVVMVQKEVADRIVAQPGGKEYGTLTVAINYYAEAEVVTKVPNNVFIPKPEVDSAVVKLTRWKQPPVQVDDSELLFKIIKAAFGKRRKTLLNSVSSGLQLEKDVIKRALAEAGVDAQLRAENLSLDNFAAIANKLNKIQP